MSRLEVESITWIHHVTHKLERNLPFTVLNVYQRPFALIQHEGQEVFFPLSNHRIGRIFLQIFHCKQIILSVSLTWFWEGPRKGLKWLTWTVVEIEIPRWHKTNGFLWFSENRTQRWKSKLEIKRAEGQFVAYYECTTGHTEIWLYIIIELNFSDVFNI